MVKILSLVRKDGVAGQVAVAATTQYEGEEPSTTTFVGSTYGGPVVMVTPLGHQVFVTEPVRFGDSFDKEWVRTFFSIGAYA